MTLYDGALWKLSLPSKTLAVNRGKVPKNKNLKQYEKNLSKKKSKN